MQKDSFLTLKSHTLLWWEKDKQEVRTIEYPQLSIDWNRGFRF